MNAYITVRKRRLENKICNTFFTHCVLLTNKCKDVYLETVKEFR